MTQATKTTRKKAKPRLPAKPPTSGGDKPKRQRQRSPLHRITYGPTGPVLSAWGYSSVQTIRNSGRVLASGGSADIHISDDLETMRAESQAFDRDNGIYQSMITRAIDCILGSGLTLQAKTKNKGVNDTLEGLWDDFWSEPEVRGLDDGATVERLLLRHFFVDGDVGVIKVEKSGLVQLVEAERIHSYKTRDKSGRQLVNGVELDRLGKPVAFHVADYDDRGIVQPGSTPIRAEDFIFLAHRHRVSQTRGVPVQQCNFPMFHRINDVCDSEAIAWQLLSRLAVIINRKDAAAIAEATSEEEDNPADQDLATRYHDFGEAIIFHGEPGEEIKGVDRTIPGKLH